MQNRRIPKGRSQTQQPGIGVDSSGGSLIDPTENVRELVDQTVSRLDDLRGASEKYLEAQVAHIEHIGNIRADYAKLIRENDQIVLQKVREVDVLGSRTESERAQEAIKALAQAGVETAETLRKMVETQASTLASQLDNKFDESNKRISALEALSAEGKGKQMVSDPAMLLMIEKLDKLGTTMTSTQGVTKGIDQTWATLMALGAGGGGAALMALFGR